MDAYDRVNRYVAKHGGSKSEAFDKLGVTSSEYYYYKKKRESGGEVRITHEVQALEPVAVEKGDTWQLKHGNVVIAGAPQDLAYFLASLAGGKT